MPILPILVILYITESFYLDINDLKKEYITNINNLEIQRNSTIENIINTRVSQAKMQNNKMMGDLYVSFKNIYQDNDTLIKKDIEENHSQRIITILTSAIVKDYELTKLYDAIEPDNIVFMSNKYGVIEFADNSHVRKATFLRFKNWESVIDSKYNKSLAEDAVNSILSMNNRFAFWESLYATETKPTIRYQSCSNTNFDEILKSYDENNWRYYSVLVPTYVYINSSPTDLIIIREINVYKMIEPYIYSINKYNTMVEEYKFDMSKLILMKIAVCVGISIALLASFFLALCSALERIKEKR